MPKFDRNREGPLPEDRGNAQLPSGELGDAEEAQLEYNGYESFQEAVGYDAHVAAH